MGGRLAAPGKHTRLGAFHPHEMGNQRSQLKCRLHEAAMSKRRQNIAGGRTSTVGWPASRMHRHDSMQQQTSDEVRATRKVASRAITSLGGACDGALP